MTAKTGEEFELVVSGDGRLIDVVGTWPDGDDAAFELRGELPAHVRIDDAPPHILEFATAQGRHVCLYDPVGCRTCFCDANDNVLYCRNMC
jgi:hypothetical protein